MFTSIFRRSYYPKKLSSYCMQYYGSMWRVQSPTKTTTKLSECASIRNYLQPRLCFSVKNIGTDITSSSTSPEPFEHQNEHPQEGITGKSIFLSSKHCNLAV